MSTGHSHHKAPHRVFHGLKPMVVRPGPGNGDIAELGTEIPETSTDSEEQHRSANLTFIVRYKSLQTFQPTGVRLHNQGTTVGVGDYTPSPVGSNLLCEGLCRGGSGSPRRDFRADRKRPQP